MPYTPESRVVIQTPHPDGSRADVGSDFVPTSAYIHTYIHGCRLIYMQLVQLVIKFGEG